MTLGEKIRKYRNLKKMTQKELGLKVGFSAATADSRIRKYESDIMAPKAEIRAKLAKALDVDLSALSDIDLRTYEDVMQILFLMENELGMTIERTHEKTSLVFDNTDFKNSDFLSYLYAWYIRKKSLPVKETDENYEEFLQYNLWKYRFPKDLNSFWKEQEKAIASNYSFSVEQIASTRPKMTKASELILQLRKMIQTGILIESHYKHIAPFQGGLALTFSVKQLLDNSFPARTDSFAEFLFDLQTLNHYGMQYETSYSIGEDGTKITYLLILNMFGSMFETIEEIQEHELNKESMSDYEIKCFEQSLASTVQTYNVDIKEEIELRNRISD